MLPWSGLELLLQRVRLPSVPARRHCGVLDSGGVCRLQVLLDFQSLPLRAVMSAMCRITRDVYHKQRLAVYHKRSVSPAQWITPLARAGLPCAGQLGALRRWRRRSRRAEACRAPRGLMPLGGARGGRVMARCVGSARRRCWPQSAEALAGARIARGCAAARTGGHNSERALVEGRCKEAAA